MPYTYNQVPYKYSLVPGRIEGILQQAKNRLVRIGYRGDSQETSPAGSGVNWHPWVNYFFAQKYGGTTPATDLIYNQSTPDHWCGATAFFSSADSSISGRFPVDMSPVGAFNTPNNNGHASTLPQVGTSNAANVCIRRRNQNVAGDEHISPTNLYGTNVLDVSQGVYLDVYCATYATSGELVVKWIPDAADGDSKVFGTVAQTITTTGASWSPAGALQNAAGTPIIKKATFGPFYDPAKLYHNFKFESSDANGVTFLGCRVRSVASPNGVVTDAWGRGGDTYTYPVLGNGGNRPALTRSGAMLAALQYDVLIYHYGVNDAGVPRTAAQLKADIQALIDMDRVYMPNVPIVLVAEVFQSVLSAPNQATLATYPGALYEMCQANPNLTMINLYRAMYDVGLNPTNSGTFLIDGSHYTQAGAQWIAQTEVDLLVGNPSNTRGIIGG